MQRFSMQRFRSIALTCACVLCLHTLAACDNGERGTGKTGGAPDAAAQPERLIFAFQKQKDPSQIQADAEAVATFLTDALGVPVEVHVPGSYEATVQAFVSGRVDIAYTDSIPFLYADHEKGADILVAEVRADARGQDRTDYDSIFVVRDDSELSGIEGVKARADELSVCFTSRHSTSGFVMAYKRLVDEGVIEQGQKPEDVFASVSYGGGYVQALQEVADGRADLCAVSFYTMEGPKADRYLDADTRQQLRILARTPGVPTHVVFCDDALPADLKQRITDALLKLSREQPDRLADVYGAKQFVAVEDDEAHVAGTIQAFRYLEGVGITTRRFMEEKINSK